MLNNWGNANAPRFTGSPIPEPATKIAAAVLLGFDTLALRSRAA